MEYCGTGFVSRKRTIIYNNVPNWGKKRGLNFQLPSRNQLGHKPRVSCGLLGLTELNHGVLQREAKDIKTNPFRPFSDGSVGFQG